jgi:methionyl-tRNA formyltransferase
MMSHRIVFMGSPEFAIPTLQWLVGEYSPTSAKGEIAGVFTQPDRPSGRGRKPRSSPVKVLAQEYRLPVLEPVSLQGPEALAELQALRPDVIIVAAYGHILPAVVLDLPPFGSLNVHASLLPRWRGAAPVAAAILAGDDTTGVTIMRMDAGLDTGPILSQRSQGIAPEDTRGSLTARLAQLGADLLRDTLPNWLAGALKPQSQDEALATYAPLIKKEEGRIDWGEPADDIARRVRAFHPWPGAFTYWEDKVLKILRANFVESRWGKESDELVPGMVIAGDEGPEVITGRGALQLYELQLAGKRPMSADDFARGARGFVGGRLI